MKGRVRSNAIHEWNLSQCVSASSPLVGFSELNDDTIKGITSLLSVEHEC